MDVEIVDVPVPQVLEEIVALVACRRQATARVDVHASQADCAWPGENGRSPRRAQPVAAALFDDAARTSLLQVLVV